MSDSDDKNPFEGSHYYVKPESCVECVSHADTPRCAEACPTEGSIVWDMPFTTDFEEYFTVGNENGTYKIREHKKKGLMMPSVKAQPFMEEIGMGVRESHSNVMDSF
jgi:Fe-S-cluster-containing dehydrogenase component